MDFEFWMKNGEESGVAELQAVGLGSFLGFDPIVSQVY